MDYGFDRYLRHAELTQWLHDTAAAHPDLVTIESYGRSHGGRELWLATITDRSTGEHHTKPAHWVDANIHSVEVTGGVAALHLIHHLVTGFGSDDTVTRALRTRTFYVAPRVNPDGVEWTLADSPQYRRSSVRAWPWRDAHRAPGLHERDMDGDGRVLSMRIPDPNGAWMVSDLDPRVMKAVPIDGTAPGVARYRLMFEGEIVDHDGFTIPTPRPPQSLDMNRNFPAGWGTEVRGSGDHPLSEPEIDGLVRAMVARPNICGYNAYHTSGGVLLRPSSTKSDGDLSPVDVWVWKQLGERGHALTGYTVHSVFEDFTWDKKVTMSGAADDWVYEHLGVYGWTTEFWDLIHAATGTKQSTHFWYVGPTEAEEVAVLKWADEHGHQGVYVDWYPYEHPQLGPVELGGWDDMCSWTNPPLALLAAEVRPHAEFAVFQALAAPELEVLHTRAESLGGDTWRLEVGIANTGFLPTDVSAHARSTRMVLPIVAQVDTGSGVEVLGGPARLELGQLEGRSEARFSGRHDGTPDRTLATWVVRASAGAEVRVQVSHQRAGSVEAAVVLGS
ncbi:MAG: M14 family metallopeptidase [Acidimicrobiales bacterium]